MKVIIFDIDGTLANLEGRENHLKSEHPDWKSFNADMDKDVPNLPVVELYKTLWETGKYEMIIVSGRKEQFRKLTETWLFWHKIPFKTLLMRQDNDNRPDSKMKQDILNQLQKDGKEILFVVDDRQSVVDMWRANGITCLQCKKGNY